jgi:hypothetical protein
MKTISFYDSYPKQHFCQVGIIIQIMTRVFPCQHNIPPTRFISWYDHLSWLKCLDSWLQVSPIIFEIGPQLYPPYFCWWKFLFNSKMCAEPPLEPPVNYEIIGVPKFPCLFLLVHIPIYPIAVIRFQWGLFIRVKAWFGIVSIHFLGPTWEVFNVINVTLAISIPISGWCFTILQPSFWYVKTTI